MRAPSVELSELIQDGTRQIVGALRRAAAAGLDSDELTRILAAAFTGRNQIDAAVTGAIGALDDACQRVPDGALTRGLSCPTWLSFELHISSNAAHAQVHLARQLPSLQVTARAFERGELSAQHASVICRSVDAVMRGGGDPDTAETLMLQEARQRDPRDLLRYGLGLLHRLAPEEMEAEEERRHRRRFLRLSEVFDGGYELEGARI